MQVRALEVRLEKASLSQRSPILLLMLAALMTIAPPAFAQDQQQVTSDFLATLEGHWLGAGQSRTEVDAPFSEASCDFTMEFSTGRRTLETRGRCAGGPISFAGEGTLVVETGGVLTGTLFSPFGAVLVSSSASLSSTGMVVEATYRRPRSQATVQIRSTISPVARVGDEIGFTVQGEVLDPATATFVPASEMRFMLAAE